MRVLCIEYQTIWAHFAQTFIVLVNNIFYLGLYPFVINIVLWENYLTCWVFYVSAGYVYPTSFTRKMKNTYETLFLEACQIHVYNQSFCALCVRSSSDLQREFKVVKWAQPAHLPRWPHSLTALHPHLPQLSLCKCRRTSFTQHSVSATQKYVVGQVFPPKHIVYFYIYWSIYFIYSYTKDENGCFVSWVSLAV